MTTKPKAKRFRIRRTSSEPSTGGMAPAGHPSAARHDAQHAPRVQRPADGGVEQALASIRDEGLTGRQLRMARRIAQKNGLTPNSDLEAVYLLRLKGVDPFQRENALDLMVPETATAKTADRAEAAQPASPAKQQLPQTVKQGTQNLPATDTRTPAQRREQEISAIQKDMARRRRHRLRMLFTRLGAFVMLPTLNFGWYFFAVATPMYAS
ncbi:MAG TPA: capsule biosynthesis protein, partial [Marivita sp.]|nr:capsule biosynthesis protein [Marivita sp.]